MQLKEFIEGTIEDIVGAVENISNKMNREMHIAKPDDNKSIEFDIAVTTETTAKGEAEIKVLSTILNSNLGGEIKQGEASRIKFGVYVNSKNNEQIEQRNSEREEGYRQSRC